MGKKATKGEALGTFLNNAIDGMSGERSDIIERIASAADISESTVGQILNGSIECPPVDRLRGFARVLGISLDSMFTAGNRDGCEYEKSAGDDLFDKGTKFLKKYEVKE